MRKIKNVFIKIFVFYFLVAFSGIVKSQIYPPGIGFRSETWAPLNFALNSPQNQDESGDEWWYWHENLQDPNSGDQIGYIAVGYVSWNGIFYDEKNGANP